TWTLNTEKVEAFKARLTPVHPRPWYGWVEFAFVAAMIGAGVGAWMLGETLLASAGATGTLALFAQLGLFLVAFVIVRLVLDRLSFAFGEDFAAWRWYIRGRVHARWRDHRFWMFLVGIGALALTAALLMGLPQQFQPQTDEDTTQVNIEMVPGTTIDQTEAVADEVTAILEREPEVERILERVNEG